MISRSCGSCSISWKKPCPSLAAQQVGRRHAHVVEEQLRGVLRLQPTLSSLRPRRKPCGLVGLDQQQRDALGAASRSVLQTTMIRLACWPLVMKVLAPLMT
jgi:hypothetical protein